MKKIIDGKSYDTDTATLLGEYDNGYREGDFQYLEENLYQTKKGQYFVQYYGGCLTEYAITHGNQTSGSSGIFLITEGQARAWAEKKLTADEFITLFGEVEEG